MVERCQAKGLDARVADFLGLSVSPASFDAGLFYVGTWGGTDSSHSC
jgi:hypothetical protein